MTMKDIMKAIVSFFDLTVHEPRPVSEIIAEIQEKVNEFDARIEFDIQQMKQVAEDREQAEEEHRKKMEELESKEIHHKESMEWASRVKSRMSHFIS